MVGNSFFNCSLIAAFPSTIGRDYFAGIRIQPSYQGPL